MQVKTTIKAGGLIASNHNEAQVRAAARSLKVQTGVKAGATPSKTGGDGQPG